MSSEMRELIAKWKFNLRLLGPDVARRVLESCIADVDTILARTEAGADAVREALAGQPIYLMGREHINQDRRPLAELVYGMTVPGTGVLFCMKDTEATIPKDAAPIADGAVGYVSADGNAVWLTEGSFSLKPAAGTNLFTHPQDASGDAEIDEKLKAIVAEYNDLIRHMSAGGDFFEFQAAMQAKEAK